MAGPPYDPEDSSTGIGRRPAGAPDFVPPASPTYDADPDVAAQERGVGGPDAKETAAGNKESSALGGLSVGTGDEKPTWNTALEDEGKKGFGKSLWARLSNKKKATVAGFATSLILGGGMTGLMATPGIEILQLMHYSETLKSIVQPRATQRNTRISKYYRSMYDLNNPGRTRLSFLQNVNHTKVMASLEKSGVVIRSDARFGRLSTVGIEATKFEKYKGKSTAQIKELIAQEYNTPSGKVRMLTDNGKVYFSMENASLSAQNAFLKDVVAMQGKGRLAAAVEMRHLRKFYNVPSIFHPFKYAQAAAERGINNMLSKILEKRNKLLQDKLKVANEKLTTFRTRYGTQLKVTGGALAAIQLVCTAVNTADAIVQLNKENFIMPGAAAAAEGMAFSDQAITPARISDDVAWENIDAQNYGMQDPKTHRTVLEADSIRAAQGLPPLSDSTPGVSEFRAAKKEMHNGFAYVTPASQFSSAIKSTGAGKEFTDVACSEGGQAFTFLVGIGLSITAGPAGAIVSIAGGSIIGKIIEGGLGYLTKSLAAKVPDFVVHQGMMGGEFDALGVMALGNMSGITSGDSQLSAAARTNLVKEVGAEQRMLDANKSFYARALSPTNHRSLVAKVIDGINPTPSMNLQNATQSFANIGTSLLRLPATLLSARSFAAAPDTTALFSGTPFYASPPEVMAIQDIRANANEVADLFDAGSIDTARVLTCYGNTIAKNTDPATGVTYLDSYVTKAIYPSDSDYQAAKCNDMSNQTWVKTTAFVQSVQDAENDSCRNANYEQSCARMGYAGNTGINSSGATTATAAIGTPATSTGTASTQPSKDGWTWPTDGHSISQQWSVWYDDGKGKSGYHKGIDIRANLDDPVYAAHDGTIVATSGGCGGTYLIQATGTNLYFAYQHLRPVSLSVGAVVKAGQQIGTIGPIGTCGSGTHLHFSIEKGPRISVYASDINQTEDPLKYLP